jgi:predicted RNA-binding protein with PUA-like domain
MPAAWLLKTEPSEYSYDDLERDGRTVWDGITNPVALKNLGATRKGDTVVVYHTGGERRAVGLAQVAAGPRGDPPVIELAPRRRLARPVTLDQIKAAPAFRTSPLVKIGRLSVVPLDETQLRTLLELAGSA